MKTIFITGHDTGIGKTWITGYIVRKLSLEKKQVQVIKAVETGVKRSTATTEEGDIECILKGSNREYVSGLTLNSFSAPLAPVSAAELEGKKLIFENIIDEINRLPQTQWRLIEAAGGVAVPLDMEGKDGRELVVELKVDYIVVVVENRLGAINQSRLVLSYIPKGIRAGLWFNDLKPRDELVTGSNFKELRLLKQPLWGHHGFKQLEPDFCYAPFFNE